MAIRVEGLERVRQTLQRAYELAEAEVIRRLSRLGEECVSMIRDRSAEESWLDHTGNLRNSIGYVVVRRGDTLHEAGFGAAHTKPQEPKTSSKRGGGRKSSTIRADPAQGAIEGRAVAQRAAEELKGRDYALILVAGMHYAVYVEAMEHKDVLAATEVKARAKMPEVARRLTNSIITQISKL